MYRKIWFFFVIIYLIYEIIRCYRKKSINVNTTETTICLLVVISAFRDWPFYLDERLCAGILCLLYGMGTFYGWLKKRKLQEHSMAYFFLALFLFFLAISQFGEYYNVTDLWVLSPKVYSD